MKRVIRKVFESKIWFLMPIAGLFIENNWVQVVFWLLVLIIFSVLVPQHYNKIRELNKI